jgi:hypothetical protein
MRILARILPGFLLNALPAPVELTRCPACNGTGRQPNCPPALASR